MQRRRLKRPAAERNRRRRERKRWKVFGNESEVTEAPEVMVAEVVTSGRTGAGGGESQDRRLQDAADHLTVFHTEAHRLQGAVWTPTSPQIDEHPDEVVGDVMIGRRQCLAHPLALVRHLYHLLDQEGTTMQGGTSILGADPARCLELGTVSTTQGLIPGMGGAGVGIATVIGNALLLLMRHLAHHPLEDTARGLFLARFHAAQHQHHDAGNIHTGTVHPHILGPGLAH